MPLSATEIAVAAAVACAALALPRPAWRIERWFVLGLAFALALYIGVTRIPPAGGLQATYWAAAERSGAPERSIEPRIDKRLELAGDEFDVGFFNDARRFNFGADQQPGRDQLPFSVRWDGWLLVPSDGLRTFELDAMGAAQITLDGAEVLRTETTPLRHHAQADARLTVGLHPITVEYARPEARVPAVRVQWQREPGGPLELIDERSLRTRADVGALPSEIRTAVDALLLVLVAGWLGLRCVAAPAFGKEDWFKAGLAAVPLVFLAHGMLVHESLIGRTTILSGLDDWLVYESAARDILLNGLLMDGGQGHAPPYYGQPLYQYALAAMHWLTGESLFGPLVMQYAALGGVVALTAVLARAAFGTRAAGLAALGGAWLFVVAQPEHFRVARQLFTENLYMPLVMASLIAVLAAAKRRVPPRLWHAVLLGALLGVTAITRSQFLAFVALALVILALAWGRRGTLRVGAVIVGVLIAVAPVTARNWLVSGEFVPISTSGGASLLEFHRPPPGLVDQDAIQRDPVFEALRLDAPTRTVLAFARQDPLGYLATWLPLGAHSLGLPGRVSTGVYWPLLLTVLLYAAAFTFQRSRRLHVWPIHAFVFSHLLILMLFEADTYGYRLVVPMYAPMLAVAAQLPLALVQRLGSQPVALQRMAPAAAALAIAGAMLLQVRGLADTWPQRTTTLRGLGGPAAEAAATAERVGADLIYVASIDGTPRRFGAGALPGLRYSRFKWFDPTRTLPLPADGTSAVYALHELSGHTPSGDLAPCLGAAPLAPLSSRAAREQCMPATAEAVGARFEGAAQITRIVMPRETEAGDSIEVRIVWEPLVARPGEPYQTWLHVVDGGIVAGNGTLELYPARLWEPGEALVSRLPVATDPTVIPDSYEVVLGMRPSSDRAAPLTATWQGQRVDRVPVGEVTLAPAQREHALAQILPADMQPVSHEALSGGGLELLATRPPAGEVFPGQRLRFGLLWRAERAAPEAQRLRIRVVRSDGTALQEVEQSLFGGRLQPSSLGAGQALRDEQELELTPQASDEVTLQLQLVDARGAQLAGGSYTLGSVRVAGRARVFAAPNEPAASEATFGASMDLVRHRLDPGSAKAGETVTVHLKWRGAARIERAYKIFVHVLDPKGQEVVAQRDAEPLSGRAPTSSWMPSEIIDDEFPVALPATLPPGEYPLEVGVYEERSGTRLLLPNGDSRLILGTLLQVR